MSRVFAARCARIVATTVLTGSTLMVGGLSGGTPALAAGSSVSPDSVPMEIAVGGPTALEMLAQQKDLHQWLMGELPAGTLARQISIGITQNEALDLRRAMEAKSDPYKVGIVKAVQHPISFASLAARPLPKSPTEVARGMFR